MVDTFQEFKELKNIDRSTMISVLEESFRSVLAKMFGTDENFDIIINPDKGDFEIYKNREVVADEDLTDPNLQPTSLAISDAPMIISSKAAACVLYLVLPERPALVSSSP